VPPGRHAVHDGRNPAAGFRRAAGDHVYSGRRLGPLSPNLHRRARRPKTIEPSYSGYSIGKWIDEGGRFSVLEIETRGPFKGRRTYDATGLPLHFDNESVFKERIHLDKADPNILHDEITVSDNALTRPWTVDKKYVRRPSPHPDWVEAYCTEGTALVGVGKEIYYLSGDGMLMPSRKDQSPPDLRYFNHTPK
jgi:hypothetical protein